MTLVLKPGLNLQSPTANDPLLDLNTQPSLDLQFATSKTLDDRVSGFPLVNHQRDASSGKSAGTYVGSDGLIKTSPVNIKTYSNDFTQEWQTPGSSSILSTNNPDPFGGLTAARVDLPVANARLQITGTSASGISTFSVWMRLVSGNDQITLLLQTSPGANSGDVVTVTSEWQRFSTTQDVGSGGGIQIRNSTATPSVIEVYGAQVEEGTTASTYIPTTTTISGAPRFDHDPVTGESLGLLIEETRTNLFTYSEEFDNSGWSKTGVTVAANSITAPDGTLTADKIIENAVTSAQDHVLIETVSSSVATYTYSFFTKAGGRSHIRVSRATANQAVITHYYTLEDDGTATGGGNITAYPDGWYRCYGQTEVTNAGSAGIAIRLQNSSTNSIYIGDGTSGIYLWGAQFEAGSFPTSYIPTTGSTVTRGADVASITGTNFSSWYNQSEGTVFSDVTAYSGSSWRSGLVMDTAIGAGSRLQIVHEETQDRVYYGASFQDITPNVPTGQQFKSVWSTDSSSIYATSNGSSVVTLAQAPVQTMNGLGVGSMLGVAGTFGSGHISRLAYYPYRLADATLQEITS